MPWQPLGSGHPRLARDPPAHQAQPLPRGCRTVLASPQAVRGTVMVGAAATLGSAGSSGRWWVRQDVGSQTIVSHLPWPTLTPELRCDGPLSRGCGYRQVTVLRSPPHHGRLGTGRRTPANPAPSESHQGRALSPPPSIFLPPSPSGVKAHPLHHPAVDPGRDKASQPLPSLMSCLF